MFRRIVTTTDPSKKRSRGVKTAELSVAPLEDDDALEDDVVEDDVGVCKLASIDAVPLLD